MSKIISARPDMWNPESGVAYQDRSSRTAPGQTPAPAPADSYKPQINQRPDGTWILRKQLTNNSFMNQIWDKTKKKMLKQWESSAQPAMARENYKNTIKHLASLKKRSQLEDQWTFDTDVEIYSRKAGESYKGRTSLKWKLDLDVRSWGVKEMSPMVLTQTLVFYADVENENYDTESKEVQVPLTHENVTIERRPSQYGSVSPSLIEIDTDGSITITFN